MNTIASILLDLLEKESSIRLKESSFLRDGYRVTLCNKASLPSILKISSPSPISWVIEPLDDKAAGFAIALVSYERSRELEKIASQCRDFPLHLVSVIEYKNADIYSAMKDIETFFESGDVNDAARLIPATDYMKMPVLA